MTCENGTTMDMSWIEAHKRLTETWSDWRWHMANRIRSVEALRDVIRVTPEEEEAIARCEGIYRWSITPYYASLMDREDPMCPVRRQAVPSLGEFQQMGFEDVDPVGDTFYRK